VSVRIREQGERPTTRAQGGPQDKEKRVYSGYGADTDILVASVKAYLRALNRMFASNGGARAWRTEITGASEPPQNLAVSTS
jgi:hypothetical protein